MMDGISTDYALFSGGARVIPHLTSRNYEEWPSKGYQKLWGMLTHRNVIRSNKAEVVLSPNVNVGECWCFSGSRGQIAIRLSRSIVITHVIYTHIGREVAIDPISSAPKEFELWGLIDNEDNNDNIHNDNKDIYVYKDDGNNKNHGMDDSTFPIQNSKRHEYEYLKDFNLFLGKYEYDLGKRPAQSFRIPENHRVRAILMKILNNHENPKFTCLYRLQVHGDLPL